MNRIIVAAGTLALALIAAGTTLADASTGPAKRQPQAAQSRKANPLFTHPISPFRILRRGDLMPDGTAGEENCRRYLSRTSRAKCETRNEERRKNGPQEGQQKQNQD
jgi:hypothetical protein